jgi:hypothetical protein
MIEVLKLVYHADWGTTAKKRWCTRVGIVGDGHYTAFAPKPADSPVSVISTLRKEIGDAGCAFAGFDFPIGVIIPNRLQLAPQAASSV